MTTAKKAAPKQTAKLDAPQPGKCRRVINGKRHMAPVPADKPNWTWCRACVDEHRAATKIAKSKTPAKLKAAAKAAATPTRKPAPRPAKTPVARVAAIAAPQPKVTQVELDAERKGDRNN